MPLAFVPTWLATRASAATPLQVFIALQGHGAGALYVAPTIRELAHETEHSTKTVDRAIHQLVQWGVVLERRRANHRREWHCLPAREDDIKHPHERRPQ